MTNFDGLLYFKPTGSDNWGSAEKMDRGLLLKLDALRMFLKMPIHVTSGWRPSGKYGVNDSQHLIGLAADIVAPDVGLMDLYLAAERFAFTGIGVYPDWSYGGKVTGGLHLDVRTGQPARWLGKSAGPGSMQYLALSAANLVKYGVVV
jgi:uncharacterized protein YcbK (DUF882 family)